MTVKTYEGNTGLETESYIFDLVKRAFPDKEVRDATVEEQTEQDIDFFIGTVSVSVKEAKRADLKSVGADYSTFAYEMRESNTSSIRNSWGINGKAKILIIVYKTRIVFYDYTKLKEWAINIDIPVRENKSSTIGKVAGCGRTYTSGHCKWLPIDDLETFKLREISLEP